MTEQGNAMTTSADPNMARSLGRALTAGLHGASVPLLAGTLLFCWAVLMAAIEAVPHLSAVPWGWHAGAVAAVTAAVVALRGRPMRGPGRQPEHHPWRFPLVWLWVLLVGKAALRAVAHFAPTGGETISTPMGEFVVMSSLWASFAVSVWVFAVLAWAMWVSIAGAVVFVRSLCAGAMAVNTGLDRRLDRRSAGDVRP